MSNENIMKNPKELFIKILVPLLILIAIIVIWIIKNNTEAKTIPQNNDAIQIPLSVIKPIDLDEFKSYGLPILIDFGSESCPSCKEMAPALEELNMELQGKAIVLFVDVWKDQSLANGFPVRVIPTQVLITSDGKPYLPSDPLTAGMQLYSSRDTNEHVFTTHEGLLDKETMLEILMEMGLEE